MKGNEVRERIETDQDFILLKRFEFSLSKLLEKHPDGVPNRVIASALMLTEEDVEDIYEDIILKLREFMKVEV